MKRQSKEQSVRTNSKAEREEQEQNRIVNAAFEAGFAKAVPKRGANRPQSKDVLPKTIEARCTRIADAVVPEYNSDSYSCTGTIAKRWQAAWDAACISNGYEPKTVVQTMGRRKCCVNPLSSKMCELGTRGCIVEGHDGHGKDPNAGSANAPHKAGVRRGTSERSEDHSERSPRR